MRSLIAALNSTVSECSDAVCGQTCGQRALLDQVRHNCRSLSRRALFAVRVWGIVPLAKPECKSFLGSQAYQFLARLNKEYSPAGGGPNSPVQEPTKIRSCALRSTIVVIAWKVLLEDMADRRKKKCVFVYNLEIIVVRC